MKTRNNTQKHSIKLALLATLLLSSPSPLVASESQYGPVPPKGYLEQLQQQASSWWNAIKAKVADALGGDKAVDPGKETGKPASVSKNGGKPPIVQMDRPQLPLAAPVASGNGIKSKIGDNTPQQEPAPAKSQSAGTVMGEAVREITKRARIVIEPMRIQPALVPPKAREAAAVSPIPAYQLREKKKPATLEIAASRRQPIEAIKPRAAHSASLPPLAEIDRSQLKKISKPLAYNTAPMLKADALPEETLSLVRALFAWLLFRSDEALGQLHALSLNAKAPAIKHKALGFAAWILEDSGVKALSAFEFWRALAATPNTHDTASFTNALALELAQLSRETTLAKNAATDAAIERILHEPKLAPEARAFVLLVAAERAFDRKSFAAARKLAKDVPAKTAWKEHARFLAASCLIGQAPVASAKQAKPSEEETAALTGAGRELTALFRDVENSDIFDAAAMSLGRIHFILGNYKAAHQYLTQVSRDTNLYIEAAVDNAWALLRDGDRNHAVGNMFTLHTPYFEGAYMPESFFLQSLGYQEICQFGDALTAVKQFKTRYTAPYRKLIDFNASGRTPDSAYYDDVLAYLSHKETKLAGLTLRELGRHPEFLRRQKELNHLARDEAQVGKALPQNGLKVAEWLKDGVQLVRDGYKGQIARFMKSRALAMEDELKFLTANISLLEYEIFAGAGQNLQLQGAQNFAVDDKKAVPKRDFEEGKEYWPYEDEIWEDELNNFRSKMVDGCAKVRKPAS